MPPKQVINSEAIKKPKPKPKPKYTPDSDLNSDSDSSYSDSDDSNDSELTTNSDSDMESNSLKGGKNIETSDEENEDNVEEIDEIEELNEELLNDSTPIPHDKKNIFIYGDERISKPFLTKYEYVRLLGDRTKQLIEGAKPMIKNVSNMNAQDIAREEIKLKVIPLIIIRPMPDGTKEKWLLSEFSNIF